MSLYICHKLLKFLVAEKSVHKYQCNYAVTVATSYKTACLMSKMAGNSVNYSLKSEIPLITVQQWRIACKQLHAFLRYNSLNN